MALEGSLQDMSLTDLFQVFRMGPKSGTLVLADGSQRGVIYVSKGQLIDAAVVVGPNRQVISTGEAAVLDLLQWENGVFTFRGDVDVSRRPIRIRRDSESLMLDALRRRDRRQLRSYVCIDLDTKLELSSSSSNAVGGLRLDLDQWRLLSQVATSHNVGELCRHTGMPTDHVIEMATELASIGLLEVVQPVRPIATIVSEQKRQPLLDCAIGRDNSTDAPVAARGLLNAIMRRIRSL